MFSDDMQVDIALRIIILAPIALLWVMLTVKIVGLRSFSKMTAFDFVVTVATGSLLAGAVTVEMWPAFIQNIGSITMLLASQFAIAKLRKAKPHIVEAATNDPVWLMKDGVFLDKNLEVTRVTRDDIGASRQQTRRRNFARPQLIGGSTVDRHQPKPDDQQSACGTEHESDHPDLHAAHRCGRVRIQPIVDAAGGSLGRIENHYADKNE